MRASSLYSYFGQAWTEYLAVIDATTPTLPRSPRAGLKKIAHTFFDYAVADLARHQLINQRTIPGFVPSPCLAPSPTHPPWRCSSERVAISPGSLSKTPTISTCSPR